MSKTRTPIPYRCHPLSYASLPSPLVSLISLSSHLSQNICIHYITDTLVPGGFNTPVFMWALKIFHFTARKREPKCKNKGSFNTWPESNMDLYLPTPWPRQRECSFIYTRYTGNVWTRLFSVTHLLCWWIVCPSYHDCPKPYSLLVEHFQFL